MMRFVCFGLVLTSLLALAADPPASPGKKDSLPLESKAGSPLQPGLNLPGAFHPFNVNGPRKGTFHCLVSDHGLHPGVMIFTRDLEPSDTFKELLQKLDNVIEKNPNVRLGVYVVFVPNDLDDVAANAGKSNEEASKNDDLRETEAAKIEALAKAAMLKHVILALTHKGDLEKFKLDEGADYTVLMYRKYFIQASDAFDKSKLTAEKVDSILKTLGDKLGATRK
jgi:hypothetical protein